MCMTYLAFLPFLHDISRQLCILMKILGGQNDNLHALRLKLLKGMNTVLDDVWRVVPALKPANPYGVTCGAIAGHRHRLNIGIAFLNIGHTPFGTQWVQLLSQCMTLLPVEHQCRDGVSQELTGLNL